MVTTSTGVSTLLGWNRSVKRSELPVPFHHQKGTLTDGRFLGPGSSTLVAGLLECRAFHKATHFCSVWFWPNGPLQSLAANMEYQAVQKRYQAIPAWVVWKWGVPGMPPLNGNMNKKSMYLIFKQTQVVGWDGFETNYRETLSFFEVKPGLPVGSQKLKLQTRKLVQGWIVYFK